MNSVQDEALRVFAEGPPETTASQSSKTPPIENATD